ncbi:DNA primase large subunit Spp2 [Malassezia furfur]|uniref:DNA primase large subunit Spp2 n=1 Tax=Malassezia furfur TaxID=55194 RepID=A0ABY8EV61_MALFU|nr:DNA primase large subunit Spp2 [Malassezia furfur]
MSAGRPADGARISFSLQGRTGAARPQARAALFEDDEVDDAPRDVPLGTKRARTERASPPRRPPPARVIPLPSHTDWREERKARLGIRDRHAVQLGSLHSMRRDGSAGPAPVPPRDGTHDSAPERAFTEPQQEGLVMRKTERIEKQDTPPREVVGDTPSPPAQPEVSEPETEENVAIRALLAGRQAGEVRSDRIIQQVDEEQMLRNDLNTCPDAPDLDAYSSMPIEEFGAAMLRGMGWKDGSGVGKSRSGPTRAPEVQRRSALLGLGAKERTLPTKPDARRHESRSYSPALRRDEREDRDAAATATAVRAMTGTAMTGTATIGAIRDVTTIGTGTIGAGRGAMTTRDTVR